jgi:hypothetical protein
MNWHCDRKETFKLPKNKRQKIASREDMPKFNIITGLQKPFRVLDQPFYNFYQKFAFDCSSADAIVTIGYSYEDEHVNKAIGMIRTICWPLLSRPIFFCEDGLNFVVSRRQPAV